MQGSEQKIIYFDENFSANDVSESLVGRKGLSLFKLKEIDIPVPSFFVASPFIYTDLLYKTFGTQMDQYLKAKTLPDPLEIKKAILKTEFSPEIQEELLKSYAKLSGFSSAWVAVRSSVIYLPDSKVLFPGVFATEVNIRGYDDLVIAIKNIYASVFRDSVVGYARQHNIDLSQLRMSIVVQRMVQSEVSGITYTRDLITQDSSKMSIEAVFGLGDVISTGAITPDNYVFNKSDLSFVEKTISPQEWMHVRSLRTQGAGGIEKIAISSSWSHRQKLEDRALREVAKNCLLIEDSLGADQNIEWVWEGGKIWVIQNKSIYLPPESVNLNTQTNSGGILDPVIGVMKQRSERASHNIGQKAIRQAVQANEPSLREKFVANEKARLQAEAEKEKERKLKEDIENKERILKEDNKKLESLSQEMNKLSERKLAKENKIIQKETEKIVKEKQEVLGDIAKNLLSNNLNSENFNFLLTGIGVSSGIKVGQILHVNSKNYKNLVVSRENIIIVEEVFDGLRDLIFRSGGVLMDTGGITSDVSIQCREFAIPAVVGAANSSKLLKDGDFVKIDAGSGGVYAYGKEEKKEEISNQAVENKICDSEKKELNLGAIDYEIVDDSKSKSVKVETEDMKEIPVADIARTATKVYLSPIDLENLNNHFVEASDGLVFCDLEKLMLEEKRHPLAFVEEGSGADYISKMAKKIDDFADSFVNSEVIVSLGNYSCFDFANLVKGKSYETESNIRGVYRYLANSELTKLVLKIVARTRNVHRNKNISLAFHSPLSGENMQTIKKKVLAAGLRRGASFNLYAIIDNPSEVVLVEDIVSVGIDGLIVNSPMLAKQILGIMPNDEKTVFSLESNSLFKTIEEIKRKADISKINVIGMTGNNETLLKKFVDYGFSGVVVDGAYFIDSKKIISIKETEIILSRGKI